MEKEHFCFALLFSESHFISPETYAGRASLILLSFVRILEEEELCAMQRVLILNFFHHCTAAVGAVLACVQESVCFHPLAAH